METLAAGYADPAWVPDKITCISASWVDSDEIITFVTGQQDWWTREGRARSVLWPFSQLLAQADVVTGHNIRRFDLRVWNAEAMRCGVEPVRRIHVEDTMSILKSKGFKKGLDNIAIELGCPEHKIDMPWAAWDLAYEEPGWPKVIERCESDVRIHKWIRKEMGRRGWLKPVTAWAA
jgi:RNase_H superfamily